MGFMNDSDTHYAVKKLIKALAKPAAVILAFVALIMFLMKTISGISAR